MHEVHSVFYVRNEAIRDLNGLLVDWMMKLCSNSQNILYLSLLKPITHSRISQFKINASFNLNLGSRSNLHPQRRLLFFWFLRNFGWTLKSDMLHSH